MLLVCDLSRIRFSENESVRLSAKINSITLYFSTMSSVNFKGIQDGIQHMGFTLNDGAAELGDNELDAGANTLRYIFKTQSKTLFVAGDGSGMTESQLVRSVCYFGSKDASTSVGRFGLGENAAHIVLSGAAVSTHILTRTADAVRPLELIANWPKAAAEDTWTPSAHPISYDSMALWNEHAINPNGKGSIKIIPMPSEKFTDIVTNIPSLLKELGFAYEQPLRDGKIIEVFVDDVRYVPDMSLALNYEDTPAIRRNETRVELWKKNDDERVYYHHNSKRPIYSEMVRDSEDPKSKSKIRDYDALKTDGYNLVALFTLRSVYDPNSNPPTRGEFVPGYVSLCRGKRTLSRLPGLIVESGDHEARRILGASRHCLSFTHHEDALMGVETNKSHVRKENVHKLLLASVYKLAKQWTTSYYNTIKTAAAAAPPEVMDLARRLKTATAKMKNLVQVPGFMDELEVFMNEFEALIDSENNSEDDL